jgi:hypothetical protein
MLGIAAPDDLVMSNKPRNLPRVAVKDESKAAGTGTTTARPGPTRHRSGPWPIARPCLCPPQDCRPPGTCPQSSGSTIHEKAVGRRRRPTKPWTRGTPVVAAPPELCLRQSWRRPVEGAGQMSSLGRLAYPQCRAGATTWGSAEVRTNTYHFDHSH